MKHLRNISTLFLLVSLTSFSVTVPAATVPVPVADVRIVIDVSGSMKQNDPGNLRSPALKLLVGLLPEKSHSGVWMFGRYVNMQVKLGTVNQKWKEQARKVADTIHSRGLYTNIEDAIQRASTGWTKNNPAYNRNLILLTDGMVDISKDDSLDKASRQRILTKLLPRLRKAGVRIHTIALSDNADEELLKTLSLSTGGWFEKVLDAGKLQRIFLRLLEQSTQSDSLPLRQNRFSVDSSITDMTLLVFQSDQHAPTRLSGPGNIDWSVKQHPEQVQWFHEQGYDMITIPKPAKGDWVIEAPVDDDNRVMVVTNLRLNVAPLPSHILLGDGVTVVSSLSEDGKTIKRADFLKLIQFTASQTLAEDSPATIQLLDNGVEPDEKASDGVFMAAMPRAMTAGDLVLQVDARSATFSRQWRHHIRVYESAVKIDLSEQTGSGGYLLTIKQEPGLLQPESIKITTLFASGELSLSFNGKDKTWHANIPTQKTDQKLDILVRGLDYNNKLYEARIQRTITAPNVPAQSEPSVSLQADKSDTRAEALIRGASKPSTATATTESGKANTVAEPRASEQQNPKMAESQGEQPQPARSGKSSSRRWWLIAILVISINVLLAGGGYLLWRNWRARKDNFDNDIEDELEYSTADTALTTPASEDSDTPVQEENAETDIDEQSSEPESNSKPEPEPEPETEPEPEPASAIPDAEALDKFLDSHDDMLSEPEVGTIPAPQEPEIIGTAAEDEQQPDPEQPTETVSPDQMQVHEKSENETETDHDPEPTTKQALADGNQDTHEEESATASDQIDQHGSTDKRSDLPSSDDEAIKKDEGIDK